jgi:hypothetical protein
MGLADDIAGQFMAGKDAGPVPEGEGPASEDPGQMLIDAVNAGDPAAVKAAIHACMEQGY